MYDYERASYYAEPGIPDIWSPHDGGPMRIKRPDSYVDPDTVAATMELLRSTYRRELMSGGNPIKACERVYDQLDRDLSQHDSATLLTLAEACLEIVHQRGDEPGEHAEAMLTLIEDPLATCRASLDREDG